MALRNEVTVIARRHPARKVAKSDESVTALGVVAPPPIHVDSPHFSGSLAALFSCVREKKIDLLDVPLLPICQAYFEYLLHAVFADLDHAASALAALSYLLERKAWALLPITEAPEEQEEFLELAAPTTHEYEVAIQALNIWHEEREQMFFRPPEAGPEPYEVPFDLGEVTVLDLARAFERLLSRAAPEPISPLNKPRRSLAEHMKTVMKAMTEAWQTLGQLVEPPFTREEAMYWFLALLELIRLGQVRVRLQQEDVQFARAS